MACAPRWNRVSKTGLSGILALQPAPAGRQRYIVTIESRSCPRCPEHRRRLPHSGHSGAVAVLLPKNPDEAPAAATTAEPAIKPKAQIQLSPAGPIRPSPHHPAPGPAQRKPTHRKEIPVTRSARRIQVFWINVSHPENSTSRGLAPISRPSSPVSHASADAKVSFPSSTAQTTLLWVSSERANVSAV